GLSVSRVGGDAQTEAMKRAVGTLRLELAQYHEMEVFMQFASDLDDTTRQQLDYGHSLMQVLRQEKHRPMKEYEQIIILVAALNRIMMGVPPEKISGFKYGLLNYIEKEGSHIIRKIENGEFDEKVKEEIIKISQEYLNIFHGGGK
ncbi:MAG TPA: F0F1 ATP synthase subunit alpha, partial [Ruminiclostridium sp.]|nr:F0F1 ATP synthase subunit alpha [Ruminiclostridium sp.]